MIQFMFYVDGEQHVNTCNVSVRRKWIVSTTMEMEPTTGLPNENYNDFFHPYVCHVCKLQSKLMECPLCAMISYCSEAHRLLHYPQHKEICNAIIKVQMQRNIYDSYGIYTLEEWIDFKKENVKFVMQELNRDLQSYEEQMFMFAKSCFICHKQLNLSNPCKTCFSVSICLDHNLDFYEHSCQQLKTCLQLDIYDSIITKNSIIFEKIENYTNPRMVYDMSSYIQEYLERNRSSIIWTNDDFISTNYLTQPLTLLFGLHRAQLFSLYNVTDYYIVHTIAGAFVDKNSLSYWEIFLHAFYKRKILMLIMVGPQIEEKYDYVNVCKVCKKDLMLMQYECYDMYYHDYVNSLLYTQPDVIIGYHAEFKNDQTSIRTLKTIQRQHCPILLTFKSERKAQENITKIGEILNLPLVPIVNEKNRFASCRPYRDYDSNSVVFFNQHLTIYRDLTTVN